LGTEARHCKSIPAGDADLAAERLGCFADPLYHGLVAGHDQCGADGDAAVRNGRPRQLFADIAVEPDGFRKHEAAAGAHLAWLPQETILFDRARIIRRIDIDLAEDASLLLCEIVVFGRAAMGEKMLHGEFIDRWRLRRGGRLVFAETIRLDGDIGAKLARPAIANGGVAIGTALIVPGDEALVERIRETSETFGGEVGISCWNGFAMARFCAQDAARLRTDMMAVLGRASGVALPRLWLN